MVPVAALPEAIWKGKYNGFLIFLLCDIMIYLGPPFGPYGAILAPFLGHLGASRSALGVPWCYFGASLNHIGVSWSLLVVL